MTNGTPLCAGCGKPMPGSRLAQGQARCRPCRRQVHGLARYKQGCRCDECRAAQADAMRAYYRSKVDSGERSPWAGRSADSRRRHALACEHCGSDFRAESRQQRFCSMRCYMWNRNGRSPSRELVHVGPAPEVVAPPTPTTVVTFPKWWGVIVNGPCAWCGEAFTALSGAAKYCSRACSRKAGLARRGDFMPEPRFRYAIYRRDEWTCQLCFEPVERDLRGDDYNPWSPSLDHVIPRSHGGADSWENLRLAHAWCNSVRGAGDYHPDLFEEAGNVPLGVRA